MEDSHILLAPFDNVHGQGFFAVFDGHGGVGVADYCAQKFHEVRPPSLSYKHVEELTTHDRAPSISTSRRS